MLQKKVIRWGILGAGKIAHSFVKDFSFMQNAELVAVAASDTDRAKNFADQYHIPLALSYEELYTHKNIDAVYIATTHNFHYDQALRCLNNGKAVLCEKPITVNQHQLKELIAAAKANHVFLMEAMWTYFLPALKKAKEWLEEGRIGKLRVIEADFGYPMEKDLSGRMYNPALAGGSLLDLGIYPIAFAFYFINSAPQSISSSAVMTSTGVDESVHMVFQYQDQTALLYSSIVTKMTNSGKIFGEEGYIEIPDFWKASEVRLYNKDHQLVEVYKDGRDSIGYIYEMQHANDLVLNAETESPVMPLSRSNELQEAMQLIRQQIGLKYPFE